MKYYLNIIGIFVATVLTLPAFETACAQNISMNVTVPVLGMTPPIPIELQGFTGEAAAVLNFDLTVQGFKIVEADAQYLVKGSNEGNVTGTLTDMGARKAFFSRTYNGASVRRQAHALADDIVGAILNLKPIGGTRIAYKSQYSSGSGEIFVADFDGYNSQAVTSDGAIVAKPAWVPGRLGLYYTSYARSNPDIFFHSLSSGQRRVFAGYSGLNTSAAVSPDGSKVAMILSKSGSPNVWICDANGSGLRHLTTGVEDSSPCWSPDGEWICFATKIHERRRLAKIRASGGPVEALNTVGVSNPTEPDWSPDGKWIAFTRQAAGFDICVMPADGSVPPVVLVSGQNPSWSPNSRTLIYNRGPAGHQTLAVLDSFTRQTRDCRRAPGSNSEPAWQR
jgi:TolB protein